MGVLPKCMPVYHVHVWCLWKPEEGIRASEIGGTDDSEQL